MKLCYKNIGLLLFGLFLIACNTKKYSRESIPAQRIEFGYMNQKTGGTNTYILADNGQLFQKSTITSRYTEYKKVKLKDAQFIYSMVDQLKQSNSSMYTIGQETHFIRLRNGIELQEWKWDAADLNLPSDIKRLDELLIEIFEKKID